MAPYRIGEWTLPSLDPQGREPLYLRLANVIEDGVRAGRLTVGQRLPAERSLALGLGISRTTATGAYEELRARGLVRGHVGRGTVVVGAARDAAGGFIPWAERAVRLTSMAAEIFSSITRPTGDTISFANGWPDPALYPTGALDAMLRRIRDRGVAELCSPSPAEGELVLREALSGWLASRGISAAPDEILIITSAQAGLNLLARTFVGPGDVVVTENPTWMGATFAFRWAGAEVVGVPLDHEGIQCDLLEDALIRLRPKLIYLLPTFHNPTGTLLSPERRRRVLDLAARFRVPVVEGDLYGHAYFEEAPPPPLKAQDDGGLVIYEGSFSKMVVPGFRIGWLVAPRAAIAPLTAAKMLTDICTAGISQRVVADFMGSGHLDPHLAALRRGCRIRRDRLVAALRESCPELRFRIPSGGYYLWAQLPPPLTARYLTPAAAKAGVAVRPGSHFTLDGGGDDHVRLCFAAVDPRRITLGVRRLADALRQASRNVEAAHRHGPQAPLSIV